MNSHARTEAILRGSRPLLPTAAPAIGDLLIVNGERFRLIAIISAGRSTDAHRTYRFTDKKGATLDVTPVRRTA